MAVASKSGARLWVWSHPDGYSCNWCAVPPEPMLPYGRIDATDLNDAEFETLIWACEILHSAPESSA